MLNRRNGASYLQEGVGPEPGAELDHGALTSLQPRHLTRHHQTVDITAVLGEENLCLLASSSTHKVLSEL